MHGLGQLESFRSSRCIIPTNLCRMRFHNSFSLILIYTIDTSCVVGDPSSSRNWTSALRSSLLCLQLGTLINSSFTVTQKEGLPENSAGLAYADPLTLEQNTTHILKGGKGANKLLYSRLCQTTCEPRYSCKA